MENLLKEWYLFEEKSLHETFLSLPKCTQA